MCRTDSLFIWNIFFLFKFFVQHSCIFIKEYFFSIKSQSLYVIILQNEFQTLFYHYLYYTLCLCCGPGSSVGVTTDYGLDGPGIESRWGEIILMCPDRPWGPPSLLYNGYRVFSEGNARLGRAADHSPPFNAAVMEE
jgi:hypothetical protein